MSQAQCSELHMDHLILQVKKHIGLRNVWRIIQGTIKQVAEPVSEDRPWNCRLLIMVHSLPKTKRKSPKSVVMAWKSQRGKNVPGRKEEKAVSSITEKSNRRWERKGPADLITRSLMVVKSMTGEHQKSELWGKAAPWTPILQMMFFFSFKNSL